MIDLVEKTFVVIGEHFKIFVMFLLILLLN